MLTVYTTAVSSHEVSSAEFRRRAMDVARWTEAAGHRGLLIYTDNTGIDAWGSAQFIIERTESVVPLVAVQPVFRHPFDVARAISTLGFQYGRQVDLNFVTGGFARHLYELSDVLDHDHRYLRLVEYAQIINELLTGRLPVTRQGQFYSLKNVKLTNPLPADLTPRNYVAGSSEACVAAQQKLGAIRLCYPRFIGHYAETPEALRGNGIRLGIIARENAKEAWHVAHKRFPINRLGEELHDVAADRVESRWHRNLSVDALRCAEPRGCYWLYPFRAYQTYCPYLVGSYQEVAQLLGQYLRLGVTALILDVPRDEDDLHHIGIALNLAGRVPAAS